MTQIRTWIVTLLARSAVRLKNDKAIYMANSPEGDSNIQGIRLRNLINVGGDGHQFAGALVCEAGGLATTANEAMERFGNVANAYFQLMALAANAAVDDQTMDILAYAPPLSPKDEGRYLMQRHSQPRAPAPAVRDLPVDALMDVVSAIQNHPDQERLHRSIAHYRIALSHLHPLNMLLAAESLFMSVENLSQVIYRRLLEHNKLPPSGHSKHLLAIANGISPKDEKDRSHLNRFDSWIREHYVFFDDRECYKNLLDASDGFEHGYESFGAVQSLAKASAEKAFSYIRRALFDAIGVPDSSVLREPPFDYPLGDWRPVMQVEGRYTDTAAIPFPVVPAQPVTSPWPDFAGPNLVPMIYRMRDLPDGSRSVDVKVSGDMQSLTPTQTLWLDKTSWFVPSGKQAPMMKDVKMASFQVNGNEVLNPSATESTASVNSGVQMPVAGYWWRSLAQWVSRVIKRRAV